MTEPTGEPPAAAPSVASEETPPLAPGWYPDPDDSSRQAYWNGTVWHRPKSSSATTSTKTPAKDKGAKPAGGGGRPGWLLPVVGVVVVVLVVAAIAFVVTSKKSGSAGASGGSGGSGDAAAGPQATGPRVGTNGVTVVLPDGWEQVPLDEVSFPSAMTKVAKDEPGLAASLKKQKTAAADALSLIAVLKGSAGTYVTGSVVTKQAPAAGSVGDLASKVEDQLNSTVHDVSVTTGKIAGHDAVFATFDQTSALVPPQGGQVYVMDPKGVAVVTVTTWDTPDPLNQAKQIAATVQFD
jgi:hypothetical protein